MKKYSQTFIQSVSCAINGIKIGFSQRNLKIQITCGLFAILFGIYFKINSSEWLAIIISISVVLAAELLNSAVEETCNAMRDHLGASYESTRKARDIAAGAVLISSIGSLMVALIVFLPKFLGL